MKLDHVADTMNKMAEQMAKRDSNLENVIEVKVNQYMEERDEKDKRECNIILHNIPESVSEEIEDRKRYDASSVEDVLDYLDVICPQEDMKPVRLGKKLDSEKPRLLKVTLDSIETKRQVLAKAKTLRNSSRSDLKKVYVSPDLTPKERDANKKLRDELRSRREKGEEVVIRNGKIVDAKEVPFEAFGDPEKTPQATQKQQLRLKTALTTSVNKYAPAPTPCTQAPQTSSGPSARRGSTLVSTDTRQSSSRPTAGTGDTKQTSRRHSAGGENFPSVDISQMTGNPSASRCDIPGKSSESTDDAHAHAAQHTKQNDFEAKNVNLPTKKSVAKETTDSTEATYFLNCYYTNANRLTNKLEELQVIVDIWKPKIIGITETWYDDTFLDSEIAIDGYTLFREDKKSAIGGGVLHTCQLFLFWRNSSSFRSKKENDFIMCSCFCSNLISNV